ncbi:nucleoid-associated protein YejK [Aliidiomarina minuta]|uniref:Nucleoid-associated protein YejK n=1 Tax=Aliidiomarina minuta TaxID=880057 RepID=A0A432W740_9GAMM|nr:nucleoid-associated protein YejK [Aliidiomarina minuta]RUO25887.1 nucleoid-associated protein YejK [Aliidiomarina minuta]
MKLSLENSIVHHVFQDPEGNFGLRLAPESLGVEQEVEVLLEELTQVYNAKPAKGYASFVAADDPIFQEQEGEESIPEPEFPKLLNGWLKQEVEFVDFSQQVARLLRNELEHYQFLDAGFLLLANYQQTGDDYLLVSFLPVKDGVTVGPDLSVDRSSQLDISKVQLAARINLSDYQTGISNSHYISFIKGRTGRKVADFFLDFLGCAERVNAKKETEQLVQSVHDFVKSEELEPEQASAVRKEVYDYCGEQWQQGEQVRLTDLDERLTGQGATSSFSAFTQQNESELAEEFPADRTSLRKLMKFQGQGGGLSLAFEQNMLGERVQYDVQTDTLTVTGTPPNLRDQLRRFYGVDS